MPKGNVTKVVKSGEQYRVTIPKGIAEAMNLEGKRVEWIIEGKNILKLRILEG